MPKPPLSLTQMRPFAAHFRRPTFGHLFISEVALIESRLCLPERRRDFQLVWLVGEASYLQRRQALLETDLAA